MAPAPQRTADEIFDILVAHEGPRWWEPAKLANRWGPFEGKGSKRAAEEAAARAGVHAPLLLQMGPARAFYAFADAGARAQFLEENRDEEICEVIDGYTRWLIDREAELTRKYNEVYEAYNTLSADAETYRRDFDAVVGSRWWRLGARLRGLRPTRRS